MDVKDGETALVVLGTVKLTVLALSAAVVNEVPLTEAVSFKISVAETLEILLPSETWTDDKM